MCLSVCANGCAATHVPNHCRLAHPAPCSCRKGTFVKRWSSFYVFHWMTVWERKHGADRGLDVHYIHADNTIMGQKRGGKNSHGQTNKNICIMHNLLLCIQFNTLKSKANKQSHSVTNDLAVLFWKWFIDYNFLAPSLLSIASLPWPTCQTSQTNRNQNNMIRHNQTGDAWSRFSAMQQRGAELCWGTHVTFNSVSNKEIKHAGCWEASGLDSAVGLHKLCN